MKQSHHDRSLNEKSIYPNCMSAIRDDEVTQLFLNAMQRWLEFGGSKRPFLKFGFNLLY